MQWLGPCSEGAANGLGVLKFYESGVLHESFYGEVRDGAPNFGVLDKGGGCAVGRVENGVIVAPSDRNDVIRAFDVASAAAKRVSEDFAKAGNAESAAYYRKLAQTLAAQMD